MSNVIAFPGCDGRAEERFRVIHQEAPDLNEFAGSLGTPDDWLGSAMEHVKCRLPTGNCAGFTTVSSAALSLMVMKLEELLYGGTEVKIPVEG